MSGDPVFPFPEPTFLWVHPIYVLHPDDMMRTVSEKGKVVDFIPTAEGIKTRTPVMGYFTNPDETKDQSGYIQRQQISAVALLPLNADVDYDCLLYCDDPSLPPHLAGLYEIDVVRGNISHRRAMLRRYRKQWEKQGTTNG